MASCDVASNSNICRALRVTWQASAIFARPCLRPLPPIGPRRRGARRASTRRAAPAWAPPRAPPCGVGPRRWIRSSARARPPNLRAKGRGEGRVSQRGVAYEAPARRYSLIGRAWTPLTVLGGTFGACALRCASSTEKADARTPCSEPRAPLAPTLGGHSVEHSQERENASSES